MCTYPPDTPHLFINADRVIDFKHQAIDVIAVEAKGACEGDLFGGVFYCFFGAHFHDRFRARTTAEETHAVGKGGENKFLVRFVTLNRDDVAFDGNCFAFHAFDGITKYGFIYFKTHELIVFFTVGDFG